MVDLRGDGCRCCGVDVDNRELPRHQSGFVEPAEIFSIRVTALQHLSLHYIHKGQNFITHLQFIQFLLHGTNVGEAEKDNNLFIRVLLCNIPDMLRHDFISQHPIVMQHFDIFI